ncbi:pyridoxal phosphate-dependent transferase [Kickxella alabastrina]|uniref:pyridoxal phosphate-dependent transferase n=1 Tax=Kickxella alabastrina TaxID=61397 RepID=UPI0022204C8A|nr:pyridoxal phosphate-dependent transferase [Kickxella alabastrina]KAI7834231.1 pyridoxal phosphate-dependent transferase [Kickxella alabastrina]
MDASEFRKRGKEVIDAIADYYENLDQVPPMAAVKPGYLYKLMPHEAPEDPESFDDIQKDIQTKIMPGITHWQSGNFFGWYPSNSSFPAMLGDMYSNMFDVIGFNWLCSPATTELETVVMDWLGKLLGLDKRFLSIKEDGTEGDGGGVIQGSASEAHIVAMLAAKEKALERIKADGSVSEDESDAMRHKMVAYFSDQTHSSGQKGTNIIGCKSRTIPTDGNFRLTKAALVTAIEEDKQAGLIPFFVCGTFGTTNTASIDDIPGIADVAAAEHLWYHIDAAYAGASLTCPEFRPLAVGIERADSFNFNPHKWMLTNFDCSAMWVASSTHLTNALGIHREYLPRVKGETAFVKDYRDWQVPLGRRFRALKLWFVMRMYGASGIRAHIREHVRQAKWLEQQLLTDGRFEIMVPVVFGLVVFRIKPSALATSGDVAVEESTVNAANINYSKHINADGRVFLVGTKLKGVDAVRAAIGSTIGKQENVELLLQVLKQSAADIISQQK